MQPLHFPVVFLHGSVGAWDELAMLGLSAAIGVALAFVLSGQRRNRDL